MSDAETILYICNKTEIPPNPSKKAHKIILKEIDLLAIEQTCSKPLVSSITPVIAALRKL